MFIPEDVITFIVFDMNTERNKVKSLNLHQLDGMSGLGILLFNSNVLSADMIATALAGMQL